MYTNADSLHNKINELKLLINSISIKPSVIAITEIKHKNKWQTKLSEFSLHGYEMYHNDLEKSSRGILVYVDCKIKAKQLCINSMAAEHLIIEIQSKNAHMILTTIYRSPNSSEENDKAVNALLTDVCKHKDAYIMFLGDFNHHIDWANSNSKPSDKSSQNFMKTVQDNFLMQHVMQPTRVRGLNEPRILDLVLTDENFVDNIEYLSPLGKSDHAVIYFSCNFDASGKSLGQPYNYAKGDYEKLREFLDIDWELYMEQCSNIETMWSSFKNRLVEGIDRYIPKISRFYEWRKPTWKCPLPKEIRENIKLKHRLWNRYMETRDVQYLTKYKKIRNCVRKTTRQIQKREQNEVAKAAKNNPKKFWRYVKNKTALKSSIGDIKTVASNCEITITDDAEQASVFNKYFSSVFTSYENDGQQNTENISTYNIFPEIEFSLEAINKKLDKINTTKSPGPDGLHPKILYEVRNEITYPLKLIFQLSLRDKQLPNDWTTANISAVHKKGKKSEVSNYRPISLTSIPCKIMETFVRDYILDHFLSNELFSNKQFGFLKGRSTMLQLLHIMDEWTLSLEEGGQINTVYADFAKAFDKVPHCPLIHKLRSYKVNEDIIQWITSFLCYRKQRVKLNGCYSEWTDVISGIPQGTILGPILFIIYINDLPDICEHFAQIYLFADDAKIFKHIKTEYDHKALQAGLNELQKWSDKWFLKLNVDKCKTVFYGRNIKTEYTYSLNNEELERLDSIKDLGVTFDSDLSFTQHIAEKINKANSCLGIIKRNFIYLDKEAFVMLYKSMVRSHLEYCNSVWHPYKQGLIKDLEKVQMRATKLVLSVKYLSYKDRLKKLKLPTLKFRRIRGDIIEMYKILSDKYDSKANLQINKKNGQHY
jgi:hypothetical protein